MNMNISQNGINLIKRFEGYRLGAYHDIAGVLTIGYGHTGNVKEGQVITLAQAEDILKADLKRFVDGVNRLVKVPLNQNQFDALVSFAFNLGNLSLERSTLLHLLNNGDYVGASNEFVKWNKARNPKTKQLEPVKGLTRRREAERDLFNKPVPKPEPTPPVKPQPQPVYYTVKKGDTVGEIAYNFNVPMDSIVKLNKLKDASFIVVGQRLRVK